MNYLIVFVLPRFGPFGNIKMQEFQINAYSILYSVNQSQLTPVLDTGTAT
jgi:hypothetical protein